MASPASVAVVGGGLAGLAAATRLKRAGARVELFERSRLLGGRATSFEMDGHVVDNGQHVYLACCTAFIDFVREYAPPGTLHTQERFDVTVFSKDGRRSRLRAANVPPPFHLFASFAKYAHLPVAGKVQIARALVSLKLDPRSAREDISFAQWLREHGQSAQTVRAFWDPFMVPALNAPLDRMTAAEAAFVIDTAFLHDRDAARFGYSTVPLATIMEGAAKTLDAVHRSSAVFSLDATGAGVTLRTADSEHSFEAAVIATSPRSMAKLLPATAAQSLPPLDTYEPYAIMDVHLWYDGPELDFEFAAILDSPVQWVFRKAEGYLCCSISDAGELVAKPSAEMAQLAWNEVRAALPLGGATLLRGAATRNPEGTYLPRPGTVRPGARTALPNLALAGAWTATGWPDTMESAVRSGIAAAQVLLNSTVAKRERLFA